MAPKKRKASSVHSQQSFTESIFRISQQFSVFTVFDDFLTMAICACTQNLQTGKSWYEDEYLERVAKYKDLEIRHEFPHAFALLISEMETLLHADIGNDILGTFFEQHISNGRKGQFFTPYHICHLMAKTLMGDVERMTGKRILDPTCGSGRMLLASHRLAGNGNEYFGIDIDHTCVKITALNLFFNGVFNSEVMCANALIPGDFVIAYKVSLFPLGIFKIETRERSKLWRLSKSSFEKEPLSSRIVPNDTPFHDRDKDKGSQLHLF